MYEVFLFTLVFTVLLSYKTRSTHLSSIPVVLGIALAVVLERYDEAIYIAIACIPIAAASEIDSPEDLLGSIIVSLIIARMLAEVFHSPLSPSLFLAFVVGVLILGAFNKSLARYSLALVIFIYVVKSIGGISYPRLGELINVLLVLFVIGIFVPGIRTSPKAIYAGKLEKPVTVNIGAKVTFEKGSDVRVTEPGYIIEGRVHIDLRGLGIVRSGPVFVSGIKLPVKPKFLSKRKPIDELLSLETVEAGPLTVVEFETFDFVKVGPVKVKERGIVLLGPSRKLYPKEGKVVFESPEGTITVSDKLKSEFVDGELETNDVFYYKGKFGRLEANVSERRINGFVYIEDRYIEFETDEEGVKINGNPVDRQEAFKTFMYVRDRILSQVSETFSERISGYFFSSIFSTSRPNIFAMLIARAITSASSSSTPSFFRRASESSPTSSTSFMNVLSNPRLRSRSKNKSASLRCRSLISMSVLNGKRKKFTANS